MGALCDIERTQERLLLEPVDAVAVADLRADAVEDGGDIGLVLSMRRRIAEPPRALQHLLQDLQLVRAVVLELMRQEDEALVCLRRRRRGEIWLEQPPR